MKIAISAESTIDLPKNLLKEYNISTLPFSVLLGDRLILDGEVPTSEIFDYVEKTRNLPKTSAVNEYQYQEHFEKLLKENDAIIHITLSSQISCAHENAVKASQNFKNVYIIDSQSLSTGIALLAIKASKLASQEKSPEEIVQEVLKAREKLQVSFVINKLDYLRKGGRCSSLALLGANLLQIRPQIVLKNGKMVSGKKFVGNFERCVNKYCEETLKEFPNSDTDLAFVTCTTASETAIEAAKQALKNAGFKNIYQTNAGATIASHCGPNTLGILYLQK